MSQVEAPNPLKNWVFGDSVHHAGWPKVADAVIEALSGIGWHSPGRVDERPPAMDQRLRWCFRCWCWGSGSRAFARIATQPGFPSQRFLVWRSLEISLQTPGGYLLFLGRGCLEGFLPIEKAQSAGEETLLGWLPWQKPRQALAYPSLVTSPLPGAPRAVPAGLARCKGDRRAQHSSRVLRQPFARRARPRAALYAATTTTWRCGRR